MSKAALLELADRVERASGADRRLDYEIFCALAERERFNLWDPKQGHQYTASLDAAMTLVPEGYGIKLEHNMGYGTACTVGRVGANKIYDCPEGWSKAITPALALTAAALRARANQESTDA